MARASRSFLFRAEPLGAKGKDLLKLIENQVRDIRQGTLCASAVATTFDWQTSRGSEKEQFCENRLEFPIGNGRDQTGINVGYPNWKFALSFVEKREHLSGPLALKERVE